MRAKFLFLAACLGIGFLVSGTAHAAFVTSGQQIQVLDFAGDPFVYSGGRGGPFRVQNFSDPSVPNLISFCLERDELLSFNTTYDVEVSTIAERGGWNTNDGDPLDTKTAFLYSNFIHNSLSGLMGNNPWAPKDLQEVFWFIEEEFPHPDFTYESLSAKAKTLYDLAEKMSNGSLYHVGVMNLYDANGGHKQSLLTTTAPEPATVVIWGVFGVCGLMYARRRRKTAR